MATAAVTYTFTNGTSADASEVNTNFTNIVTFLNNSVVHRDGSKAMTAAFDAGSFRVTNVATPTASTDAVNKAYADSTAKFSRTTNVTVSTGSASTVSFESETTDTYGWWSSGSPTVFTCPENGVYVICVQGKYASGSGYGAVRTAYGSGTGFTNATAAVGAVAPTATAGVAVYLTSGSTFTVTVAETSGLNPVTFDEVHLTITRLAAI